MGIKYAVVLLYLGQSYIFHHINLKPFINIIDKRFNTFYIKCIINITVNDNTGLIKKTK